MSPKGKTGHEQRRIENKIFNILNLLEQKSLTIDEAKYCVNTVVAGVAQYTMRAVVLPGRPKDGGLVLGTTPRVLNLCDITAVNTKHTNERNR